LFEEELVRLIKKIKKLFRFGFLVNRKGGTREEFMIVIEKIIAMTTIMVILKQYSHFYT
jgi:hypothetical protein